LADLSDQWSGIQPGSTPSAKALEHLAADMAADDPQHQRTVEPKAWLQILSLAL
jgi:hypothetical protein